MLGVIVEEVKLMKRTHQWRENLATRGCRRHHQGIFERFIMAPFRIPVSEFIVVRDTAAGVKLSVFQRKREALDVKNACLS